MKVTGIRCAACKDEIWSRHGHDFRYCKCGNTFVDGGRNYLRYGYEPGAERPEVVELEVPDHAEKPAKFPY